MAAKHNISSDQFSKAPFEYLRNTKNTGQISYLATQGGRAIAMLDALHKPEELTMTVSNPTSHDMTDDEAFDPTHRLADINFSNDAFRKLRNESINNRGNTEFTKKIPVSESGLVQRYPISNKIDVAEPDEQLQMFFHTPEQQHTINELYALDDMGSKRASMNLLGMADLRSRQGSGKPALPSKNLSEHSLELVQHFSDLGLVKPSDVPKSSTNHLTFSNSSSILQNKTEEGFAGYEDVTSQIPEAKRHLSNVVRGARAAKARGGAKAQQTDNPIQLLLPLRDPMRKPPPSNSTLSTQFNPK